MFENQIVHDFHHFSRLHCNLLFDFSLEFSGSGLSNYTKSICLESFMRLYNNAYVFALCFQYNQYIRTA